VGYLLLVHKLRRQRLGVALCPLVLVEGSSRDQTLLSTGGDDRAVFQWAVTRA
jgi:hypothetical protein